MTCVIQDCIKNIKVCQMTYAFLIHTVRDVFCSRTNPIGEVQRRDEAYDKGMEKIRFLLPLSLLCFSLGSCTLFEDDAWKEEYGSPELFLAQVTEVTKWNGTVYLLDSGHWTPDEGFAIKEAILASGPFEAIGEKEPATDRYFTYVAYWQPATSGPNFCNMSIWEDGLIRIHHKKSLGPDGFLYFSMDGDKASEINDMVVSIVDSETDG